MIRHPHHVKYVTGGFLPLKFEKIYDMFTSRFNEIEEGCFQGKCWKSKERRSFHFKIRWWSVFWLQCEGSQHVSSLWFRISFPSQNRMAYCIFKLLVFHFEYFCVVFSYLAGTEEGHIHRCSCSYNEQYLDSYVGHAVSWVERIYKMTLVVSLILLSIIVLCDYMNSWIHDLINVFYVLFLWFAGSCVFDSLVPIYTRCVPEL